MMLIHSVRRNRFFGLPGRIQFYAQTRSGCYHLTEQEVFMPENESRRRGFLKTAATGILILKPATAFGYQANSNVEVGLIGCGGGGNWIAPFFSEHTRARGGGSGETTAEIPSPFQLL